MAVKKIGCRSAARVSPAEQLEWYIEWAKREKLTHIHVYPPKTSGQKTAQARLRSEGFKLLEV